MPNSKVPSESLKTNAKSFALAAKILPEDKYDTVARLYRFCRYVDDIADDETNDKSLLLLEQIKKDLEVEQSSFPQVRDYLNICRDHGIPKSAAMDLIEGLEKDQTSVRINTVDELIRYAYRVAGTVGIMMAKVLKVDNQHAYAHAIDLGIAMQITNICRDVVEDAGYNRVYIPQELCNRKLQPQSVLVDHMQKREIWNAVKQLLDIADMYYRSADAGMHYIPKEYRSCIYVAARLYQSIGTEILNNGEQSYWKSRTVVPTHKKMAIVLKSLIKCNTDKKINRSNEKVSHQSQLHYPLVGLYQ